MSEPSGAGTIADIEDSVERVRPAALLRAELDIRYAQFLSQAQDENDATKYVRLILEWCHDELAIWARHYMPLAYESFGSYEERLEIGVQAISIKVEKTLCREPRWVVEQILEQVRLKLTSTKISFRGIAREMSVQSATFAEFSNKLSEMCKRAHAEQLSSAGDLPTESDANRSERKPEKASPTARLEGLLLVQTADFDQRWERYWQELLENGDLEPKTFEALKRDKRESDEEYFSIHAALLNQISEAKRVKAIKLVKDYALRRFDYFVHALSRRLKATEIELSTEDLLRAYEQILTLIRDVIAKQLADVLCHLPESQRHNIISSVRCKLAAKTLTLVHRLRVAHLQSTLSPDFEPAKKEGSPACEANSGANERGISSVLSDPSSSSSRKGTQNANLPFAVATPDSVKGGIEDDCEITAPRTKHPRKGDVELLKSKSAVNFRLAEEYLGISDRRRQQLISDGVLETAGRGRNRMITVNSLLAYLPPEKNPK